MTNVTEKKGRWLVVRNLTVNNRHFPHPDRDAKDDEHLSLGSFGEAVIDPVWLESPSFVRHIRTEENPDGYIQVEWTDTLPSNKFSIETVIEAFSKLEIPRPMALHAYYICAMDPIPNEYASFIDLEPSPDSVRRFGATSLTAHWDLLNDHLPWLREVRSLEQRWRKRDALLAWLDTRIAELEKRR